MLEGIEFGEAGLLPCVTQDAGTGEVLTLAYMSPESLRLTVETGEVHYFSRSRSEIWRKGETSGNVQRVVQMRYDCDGDALLALVEPAGPACHTGQRSCFHRELGGPAPAGPDSEAAEPAPAPHEALWELRRTLAERAASRPQGSYTAELLSDPGRIDEKVAEEAEEVGRARREESDERVAEEAADLLYHLSVLLVSRGVPLEAVMKVLNGRRD
ncbi:MAG: bifunctional phosphoribosyl-AMP cyclohydrolase/phosphoribosyl-ATP diphosphatase HisIE [Solirubrobacterales bacterium]